MSKIPTHYVAVERKFTGQGLVKVLIDYAAKLAKQTGTPVLRLDTNADEPRLMQAYEKTGFKLLKIVEEDGGHRAALYQKSVS